MNKKIGFSLLIALFFILIITNLVFAATSYSGTPKMSTEEISIKEGQIVSLGGVDWIKLNLIKLSEECTVARPPYDKPADSEICIDTAEIHLSVKDKNFKTAILNKNRQYNLEGELIIYFLGREDNSGKFRVILQDDKNQTVPADENPIIPVEEIKVPSEGVKEGVSPEIEKTGSGPEEQGASPEEQRTGSDPREEGVSPEKASVCPSNCVCNGDVISCSTGESPRLENVNVETNDGVEPITIESANGKVFLKAAQTSAETSNKLVVYKSKLYMETQSGQKQINVMPTEAVSKASGSGEIQKVALMEDNAKPVYSITQVRAARILFLFPISVKTESSIDAQTGQTISISRPWWSFLVKE